MKQSEVRLFLRQKGQELAESSQDRQPGIPAVTVASPKQCDLPHRVRRRQTRRQLTVHRFGEDEAEIMSEPIGEPITPMSNRIGVAKHRLHPDLAAGADLDGTSRHIVCP